MASITSARTHKGIEQPEKRQNPDERSFESFLTYHCTYDHHDFLLYVQTDQRQELQKLLRGIQQSEIADALNNFNSVRTTIQTNLYKIIKIFIVKNLSTIREPSIRTSENPPLYKTTSHHKKRRPADSMLDSEFLANDGNIYKENAGKNNKNHRSCSDFATFMHGNTYLPQDVAHMVQEQARKRTDDNNDHSPENFFKYPQCTAATFEENQPLDPKQEEEDIDIFQFLD